MEPAEKRRKIDADELESLVEQKENDRLKSILQNPNNALTRNDLLHVAVKHNNLDFLNFLLTLDYDVNARDSSGSTPLLLAASRNNFEAVQRLLDTDADVCVSDATGRSTFEILKSSDAASEDLIEKCLERFSVSQVDPQSKARILVATNCSLRQVVLSLKDAAVTRAVLDLPPTNLDIFKSLPIMKEAMKSLDVANVRALLHHGLDTDLRRMFFFYELHGATRGAHPNLTLFETFIRALVDLDILDHKNVDELRGIPAGGHKEAVRMMLECDLDVYLRKSFGYQLVPYIFKNERLDAIEITKDRVFDLNSRTPFGNALHFALQCNSAERVQYLLDVGADPNAESRCGCSAIVACKAWGKKCLGKLLLQHGADAQVVNDLGNTVFNVAGYKPIIGCVLPQLAIVEARGTPILQQFRERIARRKIFKDAYANNCKEVEAFKKHKLSRSVTLFTVFTEKTEVLAGLLRGEDKISAVDKYCCEKKVHPYYKSTLKLKLQRASNVHRAKCNVARLVSKHCERAVDSDHLVVEKIFSLLRYYDMANLASVQLH